MKPYILEETNWKQIKNQKYDVAILPWGATEPHNYHLPYGTDSLETAAIASDAAAKAWEKGAKVMVLPTIPLGVQNVGQIHRELGLKFPDDRFEVVAAMPVHDNKLFYALII